MTEERKGTAEEKQVLDYEKLPKHVIQEKKKGVWKVNPDYHQPLDYEKLPKAVLIERKKAPLRINPQYRFPPRIVAAYPAPPPSASYAPQPPPEKGKKEKPRFFINTNFLRLFVGQFVSRVGDQIYLLAVMWWALNYQGSAMDMGIVVLANSIPLVVLGPFCGVLADRYHKKSLMMGADIARVIVMLLMFSQVFLLGHLSLISIYLAAITISSFASLFNPASVSAVPRIVGEQNLVRANSLLDMGMYTANVTGPMIAGILIALLPINDVFLITASTFFFSFVLIASMKIPEMASAEKTRFLDDFREGLNYLSRNRFMVKLVALFGAVNFFAGVMVLFPAIFAKNVFHASSVEMGMLETAIGAGALIATFYLAFKKEMNVLPLFKYGKLFMLATACAFLGMALSPWFPVTAGFFLLFGLILALTNVYVTVFFQIETEGPLQGRIISFLFTVASFSLPVSFFTFSAMLEFFAPATVALISAFGIFLVGFMFPGEKDYRQRKGNSH
ncbi:MAG: MFS transporter [Thermoplasmata archaeon]|nr:MFS transporter [Thermoplasmata archaeon]